MSAVSARDASTTLISDGRLCRSRTWPGSDPGRGPNGRRARRLFGHAGRVRPRSANEWRSFWHHGGDAELRSALRDAWPPLRGAGEQTCARPAERIATLLGSSAPLRALASELGRIRADELG